MHGEEQQQTETEGKLSELEYKTPEARRGLPLWATGLLITLLHSVLVALAVGLINSTQHGHPIFSHRAEKRVILLLPVSILGVMLGYDNVPESGWRSTLAMLAIIANSSFWGFGIAHIIDWLKRRRMRRM